MDFGTYPPEVNSLRMYTGPGAAPMLTAAQAWQGLAAELHSAASSYQSVVSGLTAGPWQGPASASMAAAAATYVTWLNATAAQAEETAAQAKAAASAYQTAFMSTVPPQTVAANRSRLTTLVATNIFGRNTQAIAAAEAQYAQMWAQDSAAMYGYAASSASATSLTAFTPPQQNTNPGGSGAQAAAASQATGTAAGNVQSTVQQAFSAVPNALQSAATSAATSAQAGDPLGTLSDLISIFLDAPSSIATFAADIPFGVIGVVALPLDIIGAGTGLHTDDIVSGWNGQQAWPDVGSAPVEAVPRQPPQFASRHNAAAQPLGGSWRGEHRRCFVRSADLGRRHAGGKAHFVHAAGSAGHRGQRRARRRSRFGNACSARWRWRAWPVVPWPEPSAPESVGVPARPLKALRAGARAETRQPPVTGRPPAIKTRRRKTNLGP